MAFNRAVASEWVEGVDISVYQGRVAAATWRELRAIGQEVAVVGSWHGLSENPHAEHNLTAAAAAGLRIATYVALNGARSGREAVERGRRACGPAWDRLNFVALDCEIDGITSAIIRDAERAVRDAGLRPAVYTARWWWRDRFGDPRDFAHLPLWNAAHDSDPDVDFGAGPFGGWTIDRLVGEQFSGTTTLAGLAVDRNVFRRAFVAQGAATPAPAGPPWLVREEGDPRAMTFVTDGVTRSYVGDATMLRQLQAAGLWPDEVTLVPSGALDAIRRVD